MKRLFFTIACVLVLSVFGVSLVLGVNTDPMGLELDLTTEDFEPIVWLCDSRAVLDDNVEPGRHNGTIHHQNFSSYEFEGELLEERINNYAFEGEQIKWDVLVFDKNGIEKIKDVFVTIGDPQGPGNDIEVNCVLDEVVRDTTNIPDACNARIDEEEIESFPDNVAAFYTCIFTVEPSESMDGEYWVTVEAMDLDGLSGTMDENEYWYFNPTIVLGIDGSLSFTNVRPGTSAYSTTVRITNDADIDSGVLLDMFISGTDFYDLDSSGAKCPITNQLALGDGDSFCDVGPDFGSIGPGGHTTTTDPFCYFATSGAYSTMGDLRSDAEGYVGINYGDSFGKVPFGPGDWYGAANGDGTGYEIIQSPLGGPLLGAPYFNGNVLSPGADVAITFRLNLPEPCNGDFDSGAIYFWGEAI